MTREKEVERYFCKQVEKAGGKAYKWVSPGNRGVPDRIAFFPGGWTRLVELKAPGRKLSKQQRRQQLELALLDWPISVIDSKEKVDEFIRSIPREV